MIKIILASHGPLAKAIIDSAKMLCGTDDINITSVCLYEDDNIEDFKTKLIKEIETYEEVLLLVDIPGGTPSNVGMTLSQLYPQLTVISGLNLMMCMEAIIQSGYTSVKEMKSSLMNAGKESIREMKLESAVKDELDDLLD